MVSFNGVCQPEIINNYCGLPSDATEILSDRQQRCFEPVFNNPPLDQFQTGACSACRLLYGPFSIFPGMGGVSQRASPRIGLRTAICKLEAALGSGWRLLLGLVNAPSCPNPQTLALPHSKDPPSVSQSTKRSLPHNPRQATATAIPVHCQAVNVNSLAEYHAKMPQHTPINSPV